MRRLLACVFITLLVLGCTQTGVMSAEDIAKKLEEKYENIQDFKGTMVISAEGKAGKFEMTYEYVFKKPNKARMYSKEMGLLTITNGSKTWIYDMKNNEVTVLDTGIQQAEPDYGKYIKNMLDRYNVEFLGISKVSGRDCYKLRLTPKNGTATPTVLYVDKEHWYPLRIEMEFMGIKSVIEYRDVEFNTGVNDSLFEFTPPKGARIKTGEDFGISYFDTVGEAQKHVNFTILVPSYTASFELKKVSVIGNSTVTLMYGDGGLVLTETTRKMPISGNYEEIDINGNKGYYTEIAGSGLLVFEKDGLTITISGTITKEELTKVAESLK
ncbi:DUF4367 domain-containing protein [Archaeoglobus neptunius]|uniref:DUF4367 domain-containing protein n=1 Tax=Archaeoglobus neptunius TaxID=2798580 RepID=UPI0019262289|nr:DUF4367 domain-containing protein [Archaeoglobus neptunius]